jgi:hypothetical protein
MKLIKKKKNSTKQDDAHQQLPIKPHIYSKINSEKIDTQRLKKEKRKKGKQPNANS